ncbi:MAG TPA: hypothetical protein VGJ16_06645 [Pirellulales bacterium]
MSTMPDVKVLRQAARQVDGSNRPWACLLARCFPLVGCLMLVGCSSAKVDRPSEPAEPSLAEQVEAVRAGRSNEIRIERQAFMPEELAQLDGLDDSLERLNLGQTTLDDESLRRLGRFKKLVQLRLRAPAVTDAGIAPVAELEQLRYLHLMDVPITDAGLQKLQSLGKLESLYVDHAQLSDAGARAFVEARPDVHFHIDGDHPPGDPHDDHHAEKQH